MSKLKSLYKRYLENSLPKMKKDELIQLFIPVMLAALDESKPEHIDKMKKAIIADMARNPEKWEDVGLPTEQEEEGEMEEEDEMVFPESVESIIEYLRGIPLSDTVMLADIINATTVVQQLAPYLFSTEMPVVGLSDETLVMSWGSKEKVAVLVFYEDEVYLQQPHITKDANELELSEEGLDSDDLQELIEAIHGVTYG